MKRLMFKKIQRKVIFRKGMLPEASFFLCALVEQEHSSVGSPPTKQASDISSEVDVLDSTNSRKKGSLNV
jgi:hypothetical protein